MKVVVTPTEEVVNRAVSLDWDRSEKCWYGRSRTMALLDGSSLFDPIHYLGTATILKHKLKDNKVYALSRTGPEFSGNLIREALKILDKKRVRIFLHWHNDKNFYVLMFGTQEGTIAVAPRVMSEENVVYKLDDDTELLSDFWRGATSKLVRGMLFGTL